MKILATMIAFICRVYGAPGPDWDVDYAPLRTVTLTDGTSSKGHECLARRRAPDGRIEYRAVTEEEYRDFHANTAI